MDIEDLVSAGTLGLIEAVDRFDAGRGVPFAAFAEYRIRGAIVDAIRSEDWVPRVVRKRHALLVRTRASLRNALGREPDREEMARALDLSPTAYDELGALSGLQRLVPLDAPRGAGNHLAVSETIADERPDMLEDRLTRDRNAALAGLICRLPESERKVIDMSHRRCMKYAEIGERLGVSESRVSQLRTQALARLRRQLRAFIQP